MGSGRRGVHQQAWRSGITPTQYLLSPDLRGSARARSTCITGFVQGRRVRRSRRDHRVRQRAQGYRRRRGRRSSATTDDGRPVQSFPSSLADLVFTAIFFSLWIWCERSAAESPIGFSARPRRSLAAPSIAHLGRRSRARPSSIALGLYSSMADEPRRSNKSCSQSEPYRCRLLGRPRAPVHLASPGSADAPRSV